MRAEQWTALGAVPDSWIRTNDEGVARVSWLPNRGGHIRVSPLSAEWKLVASESDPDGSSTTVRLARKYPFRGRVRFPDGRPRAGVGVLASGIDRMGRRIGSWARTDKGGLFRLYLAADHGYVLGVQDSEWTSEVQQDVFVRADGTDIKYAQRGTFLSAKPATPLEVTVLDRAGKPLTNAWVYSKLAKEVQWVNSADENKESDKGNVVGVGAVSFDDWRLTDSDGIARFAAGPGRHVMTAQVKKWSLTKIITVIEGKPVKLTIQEPK